MTKTQSRELHELRRFAADARLILRALKIGAARLEPATSEFCFRGFRYGCVSENWSRLAAVVGRDKLADASGPWFDEPPE